MKFEFENIDAYHQRAKVHGGWLVKAVEDVYHDQGNYGNGMQNGWDWRVAMTFVPDANHEWEIDQ